MQELNSSLGNSFSLLKKVKTLPTFCNKHPDCHMMQLEGHEPFCPMCVRQNKYERDTDIVLRGAWQSYRRAFHGVLQHDSIFDDDELKPATFANYEVIKGSEAETNLNKARHIAGKYLDRNYKANTIITGVPGVGKSHLAVSILKAVNEHIKPDAACLFVSVNELMRLIKDSFSNKSSQFTEQRMVKLLGGVNLLVLDDLGSEASFQSNHQEASEWVQQVLFGILNKRNRTIITTNLSSEELTNIYNPKLLSRMYKGVVKNDGVIKFTNATDDKRKVVF
ncbi:AAA family ATPase (plasmid) [Lactobacillus curvatus]|nr:AAA family ATPase [Latilactobacillus curvatus]MSD84736.1 AAA family ATPase [Latilactobacillus curvatus]MSE23472.1 AAA family ATPase [Latilactobacillus curvatus]MSE24936.1 AAA family ATPase [Latilactobacillus curvatus]